MGKAQEAQPYTENSRNRGMLRMRKTVFSREQQTNWLNTKWPTLKIYTYGNIIQTEKLVFIQLGLYVYTHTDVTRINEKEVKNLKQRNEVYMGGLVAKKWKGV